MNIEEVKDMLYSVTEMFFTGATIIWTEQINTKPPLPYVTLKIGSIQRNSFPIVSEDGTRYYQCRTTAEINLYTKGKPLNHDAKVTGNFINTATWDMMDFFNFVESENITDVLAGKGMDISLMPPVRDLTDLQNDRNYRYRSMAEAMVSFAVEADGSYGIASMVTVPNSSGGGTVEISETKTEVIEDIVIIESTGGMNNNEE